MNQIGFKERIFIVNYKLLIVKIEALKVLQSDLKKKFKSKRDLYNYS